MRASPIYHEFDKEFDEVKSMYDSKCEELARYFLAEDAEGEAKELLVKNLAQHIQNEVEAWFEVN